MQIRVEGVVPEGSNINISCCNQTKVIDALDKSTTFNVCKPENLILKMEEKESKSNHSLGYILMFILTSIIQGLFNILFMNTDSKWYQNVRAYSTKVSIPLNENNDVVIKFKLYESKYTGNGIIWESPKFCLSSNRRFNIVYEKNPLEISNAYFNYLKKVVSASLIILLIFTLLLILTFEHIFIARYIITALLILLIVLTLGIIIKEYKRYKTLLNAFISKE